MTAPPADRASRQRGRRLAAGRGRSGRRPVRRRAVELAERVGLRRERASPRSRSSPPSWPPTWSSTPTRASSLLRAAAQRRPAGVELVAVDRGPGMRDLTPLFADGHSTAGTLGIGLGAIRRLATGPTSHSVARPGHRPRRQFWPDAPAPAAARRPGLTRAARPARRCAATRYAARPHRRRAACCWSATASATARWPPRRQRARPRSSATSEPESPAALLERLHRRHVRTPGAPRSRSPARRRGRPADVRRRRQHRRPVVDRTQPRGHGLAARHRRPQPARRSGEYDYPLGPSAWWSAHRRADRPVGPRATTGLLGRSPLVVAATLLRDAGIRRDDACVLVVPGAGHDATEPVLPHCGSRDEPDVFAVRQRGREVAAAVGVGAPGPGPGGHRAERGRPARARPRGGGDVTFDARPSRTAPRRRWSPSTRRGRRSRRRARGGRRLLDQVGRGDRTTTAAPSVTLGIVAADPPVLARRRPATGARRAQLPRHASPRTPLDELRDPEQRADRRAGRGAAPSATSLRPAQRRAGGDQPRRDGALQRALRRAGGDQPGRGRALRRAGREVRAAARGQRGQEPVPGPTSATSCAPRSPPSSGWPGCCSTRRPTR